MNLKFADQNLATDYGYGSGLGSGSGDGSGFGSGRGSGSGGRFDDGSGSDDGFGLGGGFRSSYGSGYDDGTGYSERLIKWLNIGLTHMDLGILDIFDVQCYHMRTKSQIV